MISAFGILTSMFLAWTYNDILSIQGVQGRYFIPIAPVLFLVFRINQFGLKHDPLQWMSMSTFGLNQIYLLTVLAGALRILD